MWQSRWADDAKLRRKQTPCLPIHKSIVSRSSKAKVVENYQYSFALIRERLKLFFAQLFLLISSVLTEQSQICVKNANPSMLEQGDLFWQDNLTQCLCRQVRWWKHLHLRPMILRKKIYCKSTKNEWKGYHNKIVWLSFVLMQDSWQRLTSDSTSWQKTRKNSHNLRSQWLVVSTLCQEMKYHLTRKVGFEGTLKLGPYWKSQPETYKVNMEWKSEFESMNKDNSHSWVRISHGLNKLVTDLSNNKENDNNEQETSEMQFDNFAFKSNERAFASRSKAKAKPQRRTSASSSTKTLHIRERKLTDVEPEDYSPVAYPVWKQLSTLLRHGHLPREDDGAIDFWRIKEYLRNDFVQSQHWSDEKWKSTMAKSGGNGERFQYCTDLSGQEILYLQALQGHSGRNLIDPSLQDNVSIPNDFFEYIHHIGCAVSVHSITNSRLIAGGQNPSKERQTVFFICGSYEQRTQRSWGDRLECTASCTVHAYSMEETSKHGVLGRYNTCSKEKIIVLSNAIERNHPLRHVPSLLYPEGDYDGIWRNLIQESVCVTSTSSKYFL